MAFRRFRRSRARRFSRRARNDLIPFSACQFTASLQIPGNFNCANDQGHSDTVFVFPQLWGGLPTFGPTGEAESAFAFDKLSRGLKFRGMNFQFAIQCPIIDTTDQAEVLNVQQPFRAAWFKTQLIPDETGGTVGVIPNIPNLWSEMEQEWTDCLWRHQGILQFTGFAFGNHPNVQVSIPFTECFSTGTRFDPHFRVKTRRNLNENEALMFVVSIANPLGFEGAENFSVDIELMGFAACKNWM